MSGASGAEAKIGEADYRGGGGLIVHHAEKLVHERWSEYLGADTQTRPGAFAAYTTALEAEATAARRLAAA